MDDSCGGWSNSSGSGYSCAARFVGCSSSSLVLASSATTVRLEAFEAPVFFVASRAPPIETQLRASHTSSGCPRPKRSTTGSRPMSDPYADRGQRPGYGDRDRASVASPDRTAAEIAAVGRPPMTQEDTCVLEFCSHWIPSMNVEDPSRNVVCAFWNASWGLELGASNGGLELGPRAGASNWGLELEPRAGASSWGLELGPRAGAQRRARG